MMNACDAISSGENKESGKIVIKTKIIVNNGQPDMIKIEFIDNGPGILADNLVNIFVQGKRNKTGWFLKIICQYEATVI